MAIINFANAVMADGPIGYWRLGEPPPPTDLSYPWGTKDTSGNGNDGAVIDSVGDGPPTGITFGQRTLHGGVKISRPALGDTAALFDGKTGRIIVLNSYSLNPRYLTIEAIVRWAGPTQYQQRILEKSSYPELAQYGLSINSPDGKIVVELRTSAATTSFKAESTAPVTQGVGTHVAATYDGIGIQIYINGASVGHTHGHGPGNLSDGAKPPTPANLIESGVGIGNQTQRNRPFNGLIDELALYPTALSGDRILAHYQSQILRPVPIRRVPKPRPVPKRPRK